MSTLAQIRAKFINSWPEVAETKPEITHGLISLDNGDSWGDLDDTPHSILNRHAPRLLLAAYKQNPALARQTLRQLEPCSIREFLEVFLRHAPAGVKCE